MAGFETKFCSVHIGKIRVCNVRPKIYIILLLQIFSSLLRHSRKSAWEFCLPAWAWCSAASSPRNRAWNEDSRRLREVLQSWSRPILRDCKTSHNLQQPSFQALPRTPTTAPTAGCCSRMTGPAAASCSVATRESAGTTRIFSATSTTAPGWQRLTTRVTLPFLHSTSATRHLDWSGLNYWLKARLLETTDVGEYASFWLGATTNVSIHPQTAT